MATLCHSVRSRRSPVLRSFQVSEVATRRLHTLPPFWNVRTSGSRPRFPMRITLFTDPAMAFALLCPVSRLDPEATWLTDAERRAMPCSPIAAVSAIGDYGEGHSRGG